MGGGSSTWIFVAILLSAIWFSATPIPSVAAFPVVDFQKTWGPGGGRSVVVDSAGNIYVAGYTESFITESNRTEDTFLLKYNSTGSLLWQRTWGGNGTDEPSGITVDSVGNIYVVGITNSFSNSSRCPNCFDIFALKFSPMGAMIWQKTWGDIYHDFAYGIAIDASDNLYITGSTGNMYGIHAFVLKVNSTGQLIWQRAWGPGGTIAPISGYPAIDTSGNLYVTGALQYSNYDQRDIYLLKVNPNSSLVWQSRWGDGNYAETDAAAVASDGNVFLTGHNHTMDSSGFCGTSPCDNLLIMKVDGTGKLLWERAWKGAAVEYGLGIDVNGSKYVYVVGTNIGPAEGVILLKVDSSGTLISQSILGNGPNWGNSVVLDGSGNAFLTGNTRGPAPFIIQGTNYTFVATKLPSQTVNYPFMSTALPLISVNGTVGVSSGNESYLGVYGALLVKYIDNGTIPSPALSPFAVALLAGSTSSTLTIIRRMKRVQTHSQSTT